MLQPSTISGLLGWYRLSKIQSYRQTPAEYQKPVGGSPDHSDSKSERPGHVDGSLGSLGQQQGKRGIRKSGLTGQL